MEEPSGAPPGRAALWWRSGAGGSSADRRPEMGGGRRPGGSLGGGGRGVWGRAGVGVAPLTELPPAFPAGPAAVVLPRCLPPPPPPSRWVPPSLPPPPLPGAAPRASRRRAPPRIVRPGLANGGREAAVPRADCRGANPRPGADRRRRAGGGGGGPRVRCPAPRVRGPARRVSAERALPAPVPRPLGGGVAVLRPRGQRCWFIYFPRGPVFSGRGAVGDAGGAGPAGRGKAVPGALPGAPR